jgi:VWFA-related protein
MSQFEKYLSAPPLDADTEVVRRTLARLAARHPEIAKETLSFPAFRVDANLALVQFQIFPKSGRPVSRLAPEDIEIREDGIPQKTTLFEAARDYRAGVPIEISLLFDCSASIQSIGALDPYVFHTSLLDEYESASIAIYTFSDEVHRITKPTRDARALRKAMDAVLATPPADEKTTTASTRLFGSIRDTVIDAAEGRLGVVRLVIIFSDGISVSEQHQDEGVWAAARGAARKNGVALYPVLLEFPTGNPVLAGMPAGTPVNTRYMLDHASPSMQHFSDLGPETGGQRFTRIGATDSVLPDILKSLAQQVLRYTYVAGYYPDPSDKGKRHEAQVVLLNRNKGALSGGGRIVDH